jgi:hypothetical protein
MIKEEQKIGPSIEFFLTNVHLARESNSERLQFATGINHLPDNVKGVLSIARRKLKAWQKK